MAKDDVYPILDLAAYIERFAGVEARERIADGHERMATASAAEVAQWLKRAMERLDAQLDPATVAQIMGQMGRDCAEMNKSHVEQALDKRAQFDTLDAFLKAEERDSGRGTRLEQHGHVVTQVYAPQAGYRCRCYCSLWRGLPADETASLTWCQCSRAFLASVWEGYLGRPADVELVESCISGADECKFRIRLQPGPSVESQVACLTGCTKHNDWP